MTLPTEDCVAAIETHSSGFAEAARGNLDATVEHCPGWRVADLVRHLTEVHWFWATIAGERLSEPPDESRRPARPADDELLDEYEAQAQRLVEVLRGADQGASCWTWAPAQQTIGFVTRHQVQEAAVHHWDAAHAAHASLLLEPDVAADSVEEFLTVSLADEQDARAEQLTPLDAAFALRASDTGDAWTLTDGPVPGSVRMQRGAAQGAPVLESTAADLLLWLYRRVELPTAPIPADVISRFRALTATD